ncbi:MAG: GEVED domain-containing protein, partial [Bacteroidota bacterium]
MKQTNNITRMITKWVLCLAMMVLSLNLASAQTTVTIGSGTSTSSFYPIYSCYGYNYSQQIYTAAELSAAGAISGGNITQVKFFYNSGGTSFAFWNNWTVYLGNTALNALPSTTGWVSVGSMTQVFNGNIPTPVAGTWLTLNLTTPFQWTGGSLVVAVDENTPNYSCTAAWRSFTATATAGTERRSILYYSDGTNPNPAAPPTANSSSTTTRAQLQLTMTGGAACTGTPTPGNTVASAANVCLGSSVNLSLQNTTSGSGVSYQWQSGPSSTGPWTNFGGNFAGASASPTATTWYQCIVTCSSTSGTSNPVQVGINPFLNCYCASGATTSFDEAISNVTLGSLNNSSSCGVAAPGPGSVANQYSNFTTSVSAPTLFQGASYPASVTMTSCGGAYSNKSRMWIDFNQSGTYDANELVVDGPYVSGNNIATASVTVPLNAVLGTTGMRVVNIEFNSAPSPCGTFSYGETEDYLVSIAASNNCNGTPSPGNTLSSLSAVCNNTAQAFTLSLSSSPTTLGNTFTWQSAPTSSGPWTNLGAGGSCSYIFRLTDTFGDGWNGAQMQVRQGTSVVATLGSTFTTGTSLDVPVTLSSTTSYNLFWSVQGSWPDEVGIQILNEAGTVIYTYTAQPTNWPSFLNTQLHSWTTNACGAPVQGPTYSVASQTVATWYRAEVTCTFSGLTAASAPVQVGSILCYCPSAATSVADDEIFNVSIGTLNNSSTCASVAPGPGSLQNRYSNYAGFATVPDLGQGTSVPFSVTVGQCGGFAYS